MLPCITHFPVLFQPEGVQYISAEPVKLYPSPHVIWAIFPNGPSLEILLCATFGKPQSEQKCKG